MERKWWHGKVAYQVYPKSFLDTNGDGIGDLRGIINKLDYLKDLGVDIVWISPVYCVAVCGSGLRYFAIIITLIPDFGTMEDMDELLAEAQEARTCAVADGSGGEPLLPTSMTGLPRGAGRSVDGKYWTVISTSGEKAKMGKLPNNWRSCFGGSAWEFDSGKDSDVLPPSLLLRNSRI